MTVDLGFWKYIIHVNCLVNHRLFHRPVWCSWCVCACGLLNDKGMISDVQEREIDREKYSEFGKQVHCTINVTKNINFSTSFGLPTGTFLVLYNKTIQLKFCQFGTNTK